MKDITVQELKRLKDNGTYFQLIDVREPFEYDIANLKGDLIPLNTVISEHTKISPDKQVVIHCRSGARTGNTIRALEEQFGYTNHYNLKGGILAYANEIDHSLAKY